ncbi:MAG: C78 family peptidase [archaeon]|nr:C78 family peptidase [archaeon]
MEGKTYLRPALKELKKEEEKGILGTSELKKIFETKYPERHIGFKTVDFNHLYYYYYGCESIADYNWGCAWRSMQTLLSYKLSKENKYTEENKAKISFKNLFMKYGDKETLYEIFKKDYKMNEIPKYLKEKSFAPFETDNGWAEPFISKLVAKDFGYDGRLFLINKYSDKYYAPKEVFEEKILSFEEFKKLLLDYFSDQSKCAPIILDDACFSICVVGVKLDKNDYLEILVFDPHPEEEDKGEKGFYICRLGPDGRCIEIQENLDSYEDDARQPLCCDYIYFNQMRHYAVYMAN